MSIPRALPIVLATLGGVAIGWVIKPSASSTDTAKETNGPVMKREARRAGNEDSRIAARWIDQMGTDDWEKTGKVAKDIPTGEMKAVLDGLMDGVWGSLTEEDRTRMEMLISEWAGRDPEAALAWARNLRHPQQRELGLCFIAATVGKNDPQAGFEILAELETVTMPEFYWDLLDVVTTTCADSAKEGPQALWDTYRRIPKSENLTMPMTIQFPPGFDFRGLMEVMGADNYFSSTDGSSSGLVFQPLSAWAEEDREAAFSYLVENARSGTNYDFHDMMEKIGEKDGKPAMREWIGEKLAAMDSSQRQQLAMGSMPLHYAPHLEDFIRAMPTPELQMELRQDFLQATISSSNIIDFELLNELPDIETRLASIEALHGFNGDPDDVVEQLRKWNVPQERIDGILEKVKREE